VRGIDLLVTFCSLRMRSNEFFQSFRRYQICVGLFCIAIVQTPIYLLSRVLFASNSTSTMEDKMQARGTEKSINISHRTGWRDIEGIFIRAAIRYLSELSSKNISNQLLVDEGILPPGTFQGSANDEMIVIINYRSRIEEAIRLLNSWVRELRPEEGSLSFLIRR
jgi:hypothetical protein